MSIALAFRVAACLVALGWCDASLSTIAIAASPITADAQSPTVTGAKQLDTKTFIDVALSTGNFIDEAGRIALATEAGKAVRSFARSAVFDQSDARNRINPWTNLDRPVLTGRSATVAGDLPAPLASLSARLSDLTGISRAAKSTLSRTEGGVIVTDDQRALLESLQNRTGGDFDSTYVASQQRAYATLVDSYSAYADQGDDPALRAAARRELPNLRRLLKQLGAL